MTPFEMTLVLLTYAGISVPLLFFIEYLINRNK